MEMTATRLIPLERETHSALLTPEAALHLNRAQQTLRLWAMRENGPIRPASVARGRAAPHPQCPRSLVTRPVSDAFARKG